MLRSEGSAYLHVENEQQAEQLDSLLWTFDPGSFVPHDIWRGEPDSPQTPVLIGSIAPPDHLHQVMINLATQAPAFFSSFERTLEIVNPQDPAPGRQRYQYYKERGYALETHKI